MSSLVTLLANIVAPLQRQFINFIRIAICVVMVWIGGLKVCQYEADGIAHFVSNSPFLSFLYKNGANEVTNDKGVLVKEYTLYKNPEGKMVAKNIEWHKANGTYTASYIIGAIIVTIGILVLAGIWSPTLGLFGGLLTFGMSIVTLSFLIFTPETWVPNLGGDFPTPNYGFPYLSGAGRLVIKDIIMMAGGLVAAAECAKRYLENKKLVIDKFFLVVIIFVIAFVLFAFWKWFKGSISLRDKQLSMLGLMFIFLFGLYHFENYRANNNREKVYKNSASVIKKLAEKFKVGENEIFVNTPEITEHTVYKIRDKFYQIHWVDNNILVEQMTVPYVDEIKTFKE